MTGLFSDGVYLLCFLSSAVCAWLLVRQFRLSPSSILVWSAACFGLLALSNLVVVLDQLILPDTDLRSVRLLLTLLAVSVLLYGFLWKVEADR